MKMSGIVLINDIAAFFVEMAMLGLLAMGGYRLFDAADGVRWAIALALPAIAVAFWAMKLAPRAKTRLRQPLLACAKIVLFIVAAWVGSHWSGVYGTYFLVMSLISALLEYVIGSNADKGFVV